MRPRGTAGSSTTSSAPNSRASEFTRLTISGCGSRAGSRTRSMRYACAASNSAAPRYGLVSTANWSGGRRRHHSQSSDWMPPILGGKSFVTSRCFMRRRVRGDAPAQSACSRRIGFGSARYRSSTARVRRSAASPVLPSTISALRRHQVGSRSARYQRPCRSTSSSSVASSRSSTSTQASASAGRRRDAIVRSPRRTVGGQTSWQSSQP